LGWSADRRGGVGLPAEEATVAVDAVGSVPCISSADGVLRAARQGGPGRPAGLTDGRRGALIDPPRPAAAGPRHGLECRAPARPWWFNVRLDAAVDWRNPKRAAGG